MSFWRNLFRNKRRHKILRRETQAETAVPTLQQPPTEAKCVEVAQTQAAPAPRDSSDRDLFARRPVTNDVVRVYDRYGRGGWMPRVEWRQRVLPFDLHQTWNKPAELAGVIQLATDLGCARDVVHAARHLLECDPDRARAVRVLAEALMQSGESVEAQRLLEFYIEKHGEESGVLASLAKIRYARGRSDWAEKLLWRALELNANEYVAVAGSSTIARERGGSDAANETLLRIAALPGSWRAQTGLAFEALSARNLDEALRLYNHALENAALPIPAELLIHIGDNLGAQGHLVEMVNLIGPRFKPALHGLRVGANLLKGHLDLGQLDQATAILSELRTVKDLTWDEALLFWEMEIANARREIADRIAVTPENLRYLTFDGPIWLDASSPATELFPPRPPRAATILLLMHTFEWAELDKDSEWCGAAGLYTRALPLFFAEQLEFCTAASARVIVPWVAEGGIPPIPVPCQDAQGAAFAAHDPRGCDYVVTGHLKAGGKSGHLELRLVRVKDAKLLGILGSNIRLDHPQADCISLTSRLLELINKETGVAFISPPGQYRPPTGEEFGAYLFVLGDLLFANCATIARPTGPDFWIAQRTIIERAIRMSLAFPRNVCIRILLAEIVLTMSKIDAQIVAEFREKLALLQKEHTLSEPTNSVVQRLINAGLAASAKAEPI